MIATNSCTSIKCRSTSHLVMVRAFVPRPPQIILNRAKKNISRSYDYDDDIRAAN